VQACRQGIGQAMTEHTVYDPIRQLLSGSLMDYALPRADDLPSSTSRAGRAAGPPQSAGRLKLRAGGLHCGATARSWRHLDALRPAGVEALTAATPARGGMPWRRRREA